MPRASFQDCRAYVPGVKAEGTKLTFTREFTPWHRCTFTVEEIDATAGEGTLGVLYSMMRLLEDGDGEIREQVRLV